jgi:N-acetylneuraminic acid mutarotase
LGVVRGGSATNGASGAHAATLLADGKVLVTGGFGQSGRGVVRASAELYDPSSGTWTVTGSMGGARLGHIAIQLGDGSVLVAGGFNSAPPAEVAVASAELYDPNTGTWSDTADLVEARAGATATLLSDGRVLITGGFGSNSMPLVTAELYDPGSGS